MSDKIELTKEIIDGMEKRLAEEQDSMPEDEKQLLQALLQMAKNRPSQQGPDPDVMWTYHTTSSKRFKREIKPMDNVSEAVLALKPVTFLYKADTRDIPQFGLIAEEVAAINPDLVVRDEQGDIYTVRYDAVNAMLLNEFLKEHRAFIEEQRKVEKLEATVGQQHKDLEAAVAELKGQIQKVSAQLELSKAAPQTVLNNR